MRHTVAASCDSNSSHKLSLEDVAFFLLPVNRVRSFFTFSCSFALSSPSPAILPILLSLCLCVRLNLKLFSVFFCFPPVSRIYFLSSCLEPTKFVMFKKVWPWNHFPPITSSKVCTNCWRKFLAPPLHRARSPNKSNYFPLYSASN